MQDIQQLKATPERKLAANYVTHLARHWRTTNFA